MNVFEFRENLVGEYAEFTRSFTRIRADDIRSYVDAEYASQRFWPEPLVQINFVLRHLGRLCQSHLARKPMKHMKRVRSR